VGQFGTVVGWVACAGAGENGGQPLQTNWKRLAKDSKLDGPLAAAIAKGGIVRVACRLQRIQHILGFTGKCIRPKQHVPIKNSDKVAGKTECCHCHVSKLQRIVCKAAVPRR
jgi:hypothetical protein